MHWLSGTYAAWFNKRHGRSGHLFQGRFHSFLIDEENYLATVLRYAVLTPVRAKMVAHPGEYRWSSYRATAGLEPAPEWLSVDRALDLFGGSCPEAQREYAQFVAANIGSTERLWDHVVNAVYLGSEAWLQRVRKIVESKVRSTDHPKAQRAVGRPNMPAVIAAVARVSGTTAGNLRARRGGPLRRLAAWIGWNEGLTTLRSIAASLRLRSEGHVSNMIRRCASELGRDARLLGHFDSALAMLRA